MTERDFRPRYLQVAEDLRDKIADGRMAPGEAMPSEAELVQQYGLSRTSVRNAIRLLRGWGLVRAEQGRGTYVRKAGQRVLRSSERYQWEKDRVHLPEEQRRYDGASEQDTGLIYEQLSFTAAYDTVKADADLAEAFAVPPGTQLLRRRYGGGTSTDGAPIRTTTSYLLYDLVAINPDLLDASKEPWPGATQHQLYTVGIELDRIIDQVTARPALPDEAHTFSIDEGVSVLVLRKVSIDTEGRVVEVADSVMPADRTELRYVTPLSRWDQ